MGTNVASQSVATSKPPAAVDDETATLTRALSNALRLKSQGQPSRYDFILQQLRVGLDAVLRRLLLALHANVSSLAHSPQAFDSMCTHALAIRLRPVIPPTALVAAAAPQGGFISSCETATAYAAFAVALVSANSHFLGSTMRAMVRNLVLIATDLQSMGGSGALPPIVASFHSIVYAAMCDCVRLVPSCSVTLYSVLAEHFPHKRMPSVLHKWYTRHLLSLATLLPQLSDRIVATLMDRMVDMDVEINLDELPDDEEDVPASSAPTEAADYAAKLDDMCLLLLRYLHTLMCGCGGSGAVASGSAALAAEGRDTSLRKGSGHAAASSGGSDDMQATLDALHVSATSEATTSAYQALVQRAVELTEGSLSSDAGSLCCSIRQLLHALHGEDGDDGDQASQHTAASSQQHFSPSLSPLAATAQAMTLKAAPQTPPDVDVPPSLQRSASSTSLRSSGGGAGGVAVMDVTAQDDDEDDDDDDVALAGMDGVAAMAAMGRRGESARSSSGAAPPQSSTGNDSISSSSASSVLTVRTVPAPAAGSAALSETPSRPLMSVVSRTPAGPAAMIATGALTRESSAATATELHVLDSAVHQQSLHAGSGSATDAFAAPAMASGRGKERRNHMFALMLGVFERSVLLTSRSKYCQFAMFYACALDDQFTERFVARLLHQLCNKDRPALTRATCAAYLGSFIARASFLDDTVMRSVMVHMLSFARSYAELFYAHTTRHAQVSQVVASGADGMAIDRFMASLPPLAPLPAPAVFYATMQSIMYVVCFHAAALREREGGLDFIRQQRLGDVLVSALDPLAHTLSTVAREFVRVATVLQLVPESQLAHSSAYVRLTRLPTGSDVPASASGAAEDETAAQARTAEIARIVASSRNAVGDLSDLGVASSSLSNPLESFFPFDPFILRESSKYFSSIFREWSTSSLPEEEDMGDWLPDDAATVGTVPPAAVVTRDRTSTSIASSGGPGARRSGSRSMSRQQREGSDSSDDEDDGMQQEDEDAGDGEDSSEEEDDDGVSDGVSFDVDGGVRSGEVLMESFPAPVTARMRKSLGMTDALRGTVGDALAGSGSLRSNEDALLAGLDIDIRGAPLAQGYAALPPAGAIRGSTGSDVDPSSSPSTDGTGRSPAIMPAEWHSAGPGTSPMFSGGLNHGAALVPSLTLDGKPRVAASTNRARRTAAALAQGMRSKYRGVSFDESTYYASVAAEEGGSASGQSMDLEEDAPAAAAEGAAQPRRIVRARRSNSEERQGAAPPRNARRLSAGSEAEQQPQHRTIPAKRPRDSCSSPAGTGGYSSSATDASPSVPPLPGAVIPDATSSTVGVRSLLSASALPTLVPAALSAPLFSVSIASAGGSSLPASLLASLRPTAPGVDASPTALLARSYAAVVGTPGSATGAALQPPLALFSAGGTRRFELPSVTAPPLGSLPTLLSQIAAPPPPVVTSPSRPATAAALPTRSPIMSASVPSWDIFTTLMYAEADKLERTRSRSALTGSEAEGSDADEGAGNTSGSSRMHAAIPSNLAVRSAAAAVLEDALIARTSPSGKSRPKVHSAPLGSAAAAAAAAAALPAAANLGSAAAGPPAPPAAPAQDDAVKKRGNDGRSARKKERRA